MTALPRTEYVSLTTFRRTGDPVPTPVWAAPLGPDLVVWTRSDSGKVKRLRHTSRVTVAPCDVRGRLLGEPVEAIAEELPPAEWPRALSALAAAYGWKWRIGYGASRLAARLTHRGRERRAMIRISPARS